MSNQHPHRLRRVASAAFIGAASLFDLGASEHWATSRKQRIAVVVEAEDADTTADPPLDPPGTAIAERDRRRERVRMVRGRRRRRPTLLRRVRLRRGPRPDAATPRPASDPSRT